MLISLCGGSVEPLGFKKPLIWLVTWTTATSRLIKRTVTSIVFSVAAFNRVLKADARNFSISAVPFAVIHNTLVNSASDVYSPLTATASRLLNPSVISTTTALIAAKSSGVP